MLVENISWFILWFIVVVVLGYIKIGDVYIIEVISGVLSVVYVFNVIKIVMFDVS